MNPLSKHWPLVACLLSCFLANTSTVSGQFTIQIQEVGPQPFGASQGNVGPNGFIPDGQVFQQNNRYSPAFGQQLPQNQFQQYVTDSIGRPLQPTQLNHASVPAGTAHLRQQQVIAEQDDSGRILSRAGAALSAAVSARPAAGPPADAINGRNGGNMNDQYQTNGGLPNPGPIVNGGLKRDPPAPGDVPAGAACICVPYYQCADGFINEDGSGILDARTKKPPVEEIPLDGHLGGDSACPGIDQVCCGEPRGAHETSYVQFSCGVRNDNGINSRILQKNAKGEAEFGEWPWQAAVLRIDGDKVRFECGGTLISEKHVLTVAHCVYKAKENGMPLVVRLGDWDTEVTTEFYPHEDYPVSNIILHPQFRNTSLWNDIAVLEVADTVKFRPHIQPICLPNPGESYEGHECVVTGWGKNAYRTGRYSNIMKEVKVPVIENVNCQQKLRRTRLGPFFKLFEGFICAGSKAGEDSCKGDGGGPLSCYRNDGHYALAGLVSWGIDCGSPDVPGVYVRLTKYLEWITHVTGRPLADFNPQSAVAS